MSERKESITPLLIEHINKCKRKKSMECRYCPSHPGIRCDWNSVKTNYYLICRGDEGTRIKPHQMNVLSILGNFDLEPITDDPRFKKELAYVLRKFPQAQRNRACPGFPIPSAFSQAAGFEPKSPTFMQMDIPNPSDEEPLDETPAVVAEIIVEPTEDIPYADMECLTEHEEGEIVIPSNPHKKIVAQPKQGYKEHVDKIHIWYVRVSLDQSILDAPGSQSLPAFECPVGCSFYELRQYLKNYCKAVIDPELTKKGLTHTQKESHCLKIARQIFVEWFYPEFKGEHKREVSDFDIQYENFEDFSIKTIYDKESMTYRFEKRHVDNIAQEMYRAGCSLLDKGATPPRVTNDGSVKSYAEAVKRSVPADYHKKLKEKHINRLKCDPEYALEFVKSGRQPAPMRQRKPLTIIYILGKRTSRNEIRAAYKGQGVNTTKIIDINFVGKSMTALTIPQDYKEECCQIFEKAKILRRDFNPLDPDTNKYSSEDKAPLDRFIERQEGAIDNASKKKRFGLANFYHNTMVEATLSEMIKKVTPTPSEEEIATMRSSLYGKTPEELKKATTPLTPVMSGPTAPSSPME
jgi:hypothetical protein